MLKKISASKSLSKIQNKECDVQCMVCKGYSNTILYMCESGHFLCKTCRSVEINGTSKEIPKRNFHLIHNQYAKPLNILDRHDKIAKERELACGDSEKINHNHDILNNNICLNNDNTFKTTVRYKNSNFKESTSSIETISINNTNFRKEKIAKDIASSSLARPVTCPVSTCAKMLAIDSILQHFYFDHSKIAKITLKPRKSHRIIQKSNIFTKRTQCIAIFEHQYPSSTLRPSISNDNVYAQNDQKHILLLCVSSFNTMKSTEDTNSLTVKNSSETTQSKTKAFDNNDNLLLWLCITSNNSHSYKITLAREDKLLSYSFTGEPIHIRDNQDAKSIYDGSNCLMIKGVAASRLLDKHEQFHIFVSFV